MGIVDVGSPDVIVALASAAGRAGVAVVRLSGASSTQVLASLTGSPCPPDRVASLRRLYRTADAERSDCLDHALVIVMRGPASFTGEDVVELHLHGGPAIVEAVLTSCLETGMCRLAEPGEFSRRAFENGRLDLTRAEAIADLVDAETEAQRKQALRQFEGSSRSAVEGWRASLIDAMASLEAAIDFPDEEDIPGSVADRALGIASRMRSEIGDAMKDASASRAVRDGFRLAILGAPNVGKSTILNRLAGREAAIVSDIPGTTRDVLEIRMVLDGYVVWVADTAGLRETADVIEAEGVRRALAKATDADLRIHVIEAGGPPHFMGAYMPGDIVVANKADLGGKPEVAGEAGVSGALLLSAATGDGVPELLNVISQRVTATLSAAPSSPVTRERHKILLQDALDHLDHALDAMTRGLGAELAAEDLRLAARSIGRITGVVDVEDLLDRIFGEFCVGK